MYRVLHQVPGLRRGVINVAKCLSGFRRRVNDVVPGVPNSDDVSTMSCQGFRIHTTCQRCRSKDVRIENTSPASLVSRPVSEEVSPMSLKAVRIENRYHRRRSSGAWFSFGFLGEVSLMSRKACLDSDDVLPVKVGPVGSGEGWWFSKEAPVMD
ncbi:unnamed protein product [Heligmosomoides polygyrus]|uniref:Uncharacterized protein n=1 Tax=Heligmosomoides polygyrus TaxID=6339 RepID=A0A183FI58_HELPZ|nr:unnamed protein product [Heligmosomoides polygyrus]